MLITGAKDGFRRVLSLVAEMFKSFAIIGERADYQEKLYTHIMLYQILSLYMDVLRTILLKAKTKFIVVKAVKL